MTNMKRKTLLMMKKRNSMKRIAPIFLLALMAFAFSCGNSKPTQQQPLDPKVAFDSIITYLERSGDFINSPQAPAMIAAYQLYKEIDSNVLVIDMRSPQEYSAAHIPNSVNVAFTDILDYFENGINPNAFSKIVMVCNAGQTASYATSLLRLLGYNNVFALKWGFSVWHKPTAEKKWLARASNSHTEVLETDSQIMNQPSEFPAIETQKQTGYAILRERAYQLFNNGFNGVTVTPDTLFNPLHNFYIINYWPENLYLKGHIPQAVRYQPKKGLKRTEQLNTLPTNKPIVVYCFTGQHSSFVTAYLRLIGYEAYTLTYGANSFMNGFMLEQGIPNAFTEDEIFDYPVSTGGGNTASKEVEEVSVSPRGGC